MRSSRIIIACLSLIALWVILAQCVTTSSPADPRGTAFAGSATCVNCHKETVENHYRSFHFKTSGIVDQQSLAALVNDTNSRFTYNDGGIVRIRQTGGTFIQELTLNGGVQKAGSMDVFIGSGEKARTFGYWRNSDELFQLPLTYLSSLKGWTNSPGYPVKQAYFDRVIEGRCLECHASFVNKTTMATGGLELKEKLDQRSLITGIDCERCHGPAAAHIAFHEKNPGSKEAGAMTKIGALPRERQLDLCGVCHSGNELDVQRTLFAYRPGDTLSNFFYPHFGSGTSKPDVHGKQLQLLQMSECYLQSNMTCGTCHNIHSPGKPASTVYINKCMDCHQRSIHSKDMLQANKNCIDCHMPLQVSKSLDFNDGSGAHRIPYHLRTHRIAIYDSAAVNL